MFVAPCYLHLSFACLLLFFFKVEVSPPMTSRTLEEETVATLSVVFPSMEEEPSNGDIAKEARQPMQGVQAIQDPEASQLPTSQSPQLEQTPSPIKTMIPQKVLSTETLGGTSLSKQTSGPCFFFFLLGGGVPSYGW